MNKSDHDILIEIASKVTELHKVMHGNGRPGLAARVEQIETFAKNCPARNRRWGEIITIGIALGALIAAALAK